MPNLPRFQEDYDVTDAENKTVKSITEYHVACVFLIDTSDSMNYNNAIVQVNKAVDDFKKSITDAHAKSCIDVAFISFGPDVKVLKEFGPIVDMSQQYFTASGGTPMGEALIKAMDMIIERKALYRKKATPYYRPWIFCITDGGPTDKEQTATATQRLKQMVEQNGVVDYCVGVDNFEKEKMKEIFSPERVYFLSDSNFSELFKWLGNSFTTMSNSGVPIGGSLDLPPAPRSLVVTTPL